MATFNILWGMGGLKSDVKVINHCLSVLVSVREISEIGHHKSCGADSALRLHSSWRYRFIVLKSHSGEWRMRAADCLLLTSSREVGLLPPAASPSFHPSIPLPPSYASLSFLHSTLLFSSSLSTSPNFRYRNLFSLSPLFLFSSFSPSFHSSSPPACSPQSKRSG